jgi:glycosyltransferase involved in cell wall biosynthesis
MLDVSVVVPTRNAAASLDDCLASIRASEPREIIVVDGRSDDGTVEIARAHGAHVLSDGGRGLPVARRLGAESATARRVALIDADVVLPEGALAALVDEFDGGKYAALQAGLQSVGGPGYWGRALAHHHRTGRSKNWFGLVATVFDRDALLDHGFDERFTSGEDIELRWRLERLGLRIGVSEQTHVTHRFADSFAFAQGQFLADGHGLGRMVMMKPGWRSVLLLGLPAAAAARGIVLSVLHGSPRWIPYYVAFAVGNYRGIASAILEARGVRGSASAQRPVEIEGR